MTELLSIGEFSHITHLSIRTLRRYHEQGLLVPQATDPTSGYRYYSPDQVGAALAIRRFRELDLPLADVRRFLAAGFLPGTHPSGTGDGGERGQSRGQGGDRDRDAAEQVVAAHLRRLEDRLGRTQRAVEALRELLGPGDERPVMLEELPAERVLGVTVEVPPGSDLSWYDGAMRDLDAAVAQRPVAPPGGRYAHELFSEGHGRATVYLPADGPPMTGAPNTVRELVLPDRRAAVATHVGPHDDIDLTYGALGSFAARQGLRSTGLVEEVYLVGPRDTDQPDRWRTLVAWLIGS